MSEFQYHEFQAVERPLSPEAMATLRQFSSRAQITSSGFVNEYSFGSFKGDPDEWMVRYFDAFLHIANWGARVLMFRLPSSLLPEASARVFVPGTDSRPRSESMETAGSGQRLQRGANRPVR
ncbi:MAG: hypothetical protein KF791_19560 [Verrucomicrobiae bacterium]|nr:hypothetical protein [Verrucomicrobiae bacterium]